METWIEEIQVQNCINSASRCLLSFCSWCCKLMFICLQNNTIYSESTATFRGCNSSTTHTCTHRLPPLLQNRKGYSCSTIKTQWPWHPEPICQLSIILSCLTTPLMNLITAQNLNGSVPLDLIPRAKKNIRNSNHLREVCLASELDSVLSTDQIRKITLEDGCLQGCKFHSWKSREPLSSLTVHSTMISGPKYTLHASSRADHATVRSFAKYL